MYSFEQLKMFSAVCECGSFSAAARKLKRAQSGVSQAVANLEIALNQTLFDRSGNVPVLTEAGKALLPIARSVLLQQQRLDQKVLALEAAEEHALTIAVEESLMAPSLFHYLDVINAQYPMTTIEITTASTFDIYDLVKGGDAHIGVVYADGSMQENVDFVTLGYERFITLAAPSHPLAGMARINDADLRNYRQLAQRSSAGKELWFSYAISPQVWYANTHQLLLDMAAQGLGWAIVPESLSQPFLTKGDLTLLQVEYEPNGWMTTVDLLQTRSHTGGPVRQAVVEQITKWFSRRMTQ